MLFDPSYLWIKIHFRSRFSEIIVIKISCYLLPLFHHFPFFPVPQVFHRYLLLVLLLVTESHSFIIHRVNLVLLLSKVKPKIFACLCSATKKDTVNLYENLIASFWSKEWLSYFCWNFQSGKKIMKKYSL